jgi:hypothetical protein
MDKGEKTSLYIVSPFRTQAHLIRNLIQDKVYLSQILQNKKKNKEKFQTIDGVGCLEDLVSNQKHDILLVSLCRTEEF